MTPFPATLPRFAEGRTGRTGRTDRPARADGTTRPLAGRASLIVLALVAIGWIVSRTMLRVEVEGDSMEPALAAGDRLLVLRLPGVLQPLPTPGDVVAVHDPRQPTRILVKRVDSVHRGDGLFEVRGDAPESSTDSRTFGPLTRADLVGRAVYRYAPAPRSSAPPWLAEYDRA